MSSCPQNSPRIALNEAWSCSCRIPVFPESQIWFKTMAPWFAQQNSWQMFMLPLGKSKVSTHLEVPKFTLPETDPLKNFRSRWTSQFSPENIRKWPTNGFFPRSMWTFTRLWRVYNPVEPWGSEQALQRHSVGHFSGPGCLAYSPNHQQPCLQGLSID